MSYHKNDLLQPTKDLDLAKRQLDEFGYCLLADAMNQSTLAAVRARLEEQAAAEQQQGLAYRDGGEKQNWGDFKDDKGNTRKDAFSAASGGVNQRIWMLVNKGQVFRDLLFVQEVREVINHALGEDYLLSSFTANIANPGGVAMALHTDQWWMPLPIRPAPTKVPVGSISRTLPNSDEKQPPMIAPSVAVNVMWMLADFTEENGGTRLVPGSHLYGRRPDRECDKDVDTIAAAAPAGTAMIFDGRIWHGTGANVSNESRLGLLTTFCGPQFRPQENLALGTSKDVLKDASPDLLALLGFKIWNAYGRIESPVAEYVSQGETTLGELHLDEIPKV